MAGALDGATLYGADTVATVKVPASNSPNRPLGAQLDLGSVILCLEPKADFARIDACCLSDIPNGPDLVERARFC
jgi:hypothetical protein